MSDTRKDQVKPPRTDDEDPEDEWALSVFLVLGDLANKARIQMDRTPTDLATEAFLKLQELGVC